MSPTLRLVVGSTGSCPVMNSMLPIWKPWLYDATGLGKRSL